MGANRQEIQAALPADLIERLGKESPVMRELAQALDDRLRKLGDLHAASAGMRGTVEIAPQTTKDQSGAPSPAIDTLGGRVKGAAAVHGTDFVTLDQLNQRTNCSSLSKILDGCYDPLKSFDAAALGTQILGTCKSPRLSQTANVANALLDVVTPIIRNGLLYVVGRDSGGNAFLQVWDTGSMRLISSLSLGAISTTARFFCYLQGRYLYAVNHGFSAGVQDRSFYVFDVYDEHNTFQVSGSPFTPILPLGNVATGIFVQGRYAYVSTLNGGLLVDVLIPTNVRVVSSIGAGPTETFNDVVVFNGFAYFANLTGEVDVYDVHDPFNITEIATPAVGLSNHGPEYLATDGIFLYTGGSRSSASSTGDLVILDISNPSAPTTRGSITNTPALETVFLDGTNLYMGGGGPVNLIDIKDPDNPTVLDSDSSVSIWKPTLEGRNLFGVSPAGNPVRWRVGGSYCNNIATSSLLAYRASVDTLDARRGNFNGDLTAAHFVAQRGFQAHLSNVNPTANDLSSEEWTVWMNSSLNEVRLWINNGGVMQSVLLS